MPLLGCGITDVYTLTQCKMTTLHKQGYTMVQECEWMALKQTEKQTKDGYTNATSLYKSVDPQAGEIIHYYDCTPG